MPDEKKFNEMSVRDQIKKDPDLIPYVKQHPELQNQQHSSLALAFQTNEKKITKKLAASGEVGALARINEGVDTLAQVEIEVQQQVNQLNENDKTLSGYELELQEQLDMILTLEQRLKEKLEASAENNSDSDIGECNKISQELGERKQTLPELKLPFRTDYK